MNYPYCRCPSHIVLWTDRSIGYKIKKPLHYSKGKLIQYRRNKRSNPSKDKTVRRNKNAQT
jgi:hypothetical protein